VFTWDEAKRQRNIEERGIDFALVEAFDFISALTLPDRRFDYGEHRQISIGFIGRRLHVLVFTQRGADIRVISLRKANEREVKLYEAQGGAVGGR
jgi:uncharacterized DUF497 family protein